MIIRRWWFEAETDAGHIYLDNIGEPCRGDPIEWEGTDEQAKNEAGRRADLYEEKTGIHIYKITYESRGKVKP